MRVVKPVICLLSPFIVVAYLSTAQAAVSADEALRDRAVALYRANLDAITSVECTYYQDINGGSREIRYAQSGDKYYQGSIASGPRGALSSPDEVAWNGQRGCHRARVNLLSYTSDRSNARPACETPERIANTYLETAYGFKPAPNRRYVFLSARDDVSIDGKECVELRYQAPFMKSTLTAWHSKVEGYWPIRVEMIHDDGTPAYKMSMTTTDAEVDGNTLHYPADIAATSFVKGTVANAMHWRIDRATLKINQPIPPDRFFLNPWPSEDVVDLDRGVTRRPAQPNWVPDATVTFPFDRFIRMTQAKKNEVAAAENHMTSPSPIAQPMGIAWLRMGAVSGGIMLVGSALWYRKRNTV